jgi:hypothetical protein
MQATTKQLQFIENIEKNFGIKYLNYGFYSNGSIGVLCEDSEGQFSITVYKDGTTKR